MSKSRRSLLVIGFALFVSSVHITEARAQMDRILERMETHNAALQSLTADVMMVKYDAGINVVDPPITGRTQYLPKSKEAKNKRWIRIDWTSPNEQMSLIGNQFTLFRPNLKQVIKGTAQSGKGGSKINTAFSFINMSRAELKANFSFKYLGEERLKDGTDTWHLQLIPNKNSGFKTTDLWVATDGMPRQVKTTEPNSDWTTVLLFHIEKNVSLKLASFDIVYPKSIKPTRP